MIFLAMFISDIIALISCGFIMTKMWSWFIVDHFEIAQISFTTAIGLNLIAGLLTHQWRKVDEEDHLEVCVWNNIYPWLVFLFGFAVHSVR